jgi:flagellar motor switch protein FliG
MLPLKNDFKKLTGSEKAAIIFLCLGNERGSTLMKNLEDDEIYTVTHAMAGLGTVTSEVVEQVLTQFTEDAKDGTGLVGNFESAEKFLNQFLDQQKVQEIMGEVRGPLMGKNMWDRFSALNENLIANYLTGEYPQTSAAILAKISPDVSSKVLPLLPEKMMNDVIERMINMESIPKEILHDIEETLQKEFLVSAAKASTSDPQQKMAEIFNRFDNNIFENISNVLEESMPDTFTQIKQKMFTFEDLVKLDTQALGRVMRAVEGNTLSLALKGAKDEIKDVFLSSMPERSRNILIEEIQSMGPVRMKDVQEAQKNLVSAAKNLSDEGTINLPIGDDDDTLIE